MLVEAKEIYMKLDSIFLLMPQVVLVLVAIWILLGDAFAPQRRNLWPWQDVVGVLVSAVLAAFILVRLDKLLSMYMVSYEPLIDHGPEQALMVRLIIVLMALLMIAVVLILARAGWVWFALVGMGIAMAFQAMQFMILWERGTGPHTSGPLTIDLFSHLMQILILVVGFLLVLLSSRASEHKQPAEYLGSLLILIAGLMTVCVANELVLLFVALELVSIPTYILLFIGQRPGKSGTDGASEATVKYFFLSILSSALLLYAFSFLYGIAGSTELAGIRVALAGAVDGSMASYLAPIALVLVLAGLAFKLTIVPFHFYAPDVFEGTTHANAALLAVVPKVAGIVVLVRVVYVAMPSSDHLAWHLLLGLAVLTMSLGNLLALWQKNIRRMMAYSSIAHAGYLLIGITVALAVASNDARLNNTLDGLSATTFYLVVYAIATIGTFATLAYMSGENRQLNTVDELAGVARSHPAATAMLAVCMFSLAGVPIMAGFWGKLSLFTSALGVSSSHDAGMSPLRMWFIALAAIGVVNAAIAAAYYLRLVAVAYFRASKTEPETRLNYEGGIGVRLAMSICAACLLLVGVLPGPLLWATNEASRSVQSVMDHPHPNQRTKSSDDPETDKEPPVADDQFTHSQE